MVVAERLSPKGERAAQRGLRIDHVAACVEHQAEAVQGLRYVGMVGPEKTLAHGECLAVLALGGGEIARAVVERAEGVEGGGDLRVVARPRLALNRESLFEQGTGTDVVALELAAGRPG